MFLTSNLTHCIRQWVNEVLNSLEKTLSVSISWIHDLCHYTNNLVLYYCALFIISSRLHYITSETYISIIPSIAQYIPLKALSEIKQRKQNVCVSGNHHKAHGDMRKDDLAFIIPWSFSLMFRENSNEKHRTYIRVLGNRFMP